MWEDSLRLQECSIFLLNIHLTVLASTDDFLLETIISMVKAKWLLPILLFPLHLLVGILLWERAILIFVFTYSSVDSWITTFFNEL